MKEESEEGPTLIRHDIEPLKMAGIDPKAPVIFADDIKAMVDTESHIVTLICFKSMFDVKREDEAINLERVDLQGFLQVKISIHQLYQLVFYLQSLHDEYEGAIPPGIFFGPTYVVPKHKQE